MINIEEAKRRILSELEEGWFNYVVAMLNTIIEPTGDSQELKTYQLALEELIAEGMVIVRKMGSGANSVFATNDEPPLGQLWAVTSITKYDKESGFWDAGSTTFENTPTIFVTHSGLEEARRLLGELGYQWWRQTKT